MFTTAPPVPPTGCRWLAGRWRSPAHPGTSRRIRAFDYMRLTPYISALLLACTPLAFVHPVRVTGNSMEPTLKDGQLLLALWPWCSGKPDLGEIWIINSPEGTVIKRVLALPGQELEQRNGYLICGGQFVQEPYVSFRDIKNDGPWNARDGYILLGDNRPQSRDCRLWGPVRKAMIKGRILGGKPALA